MYLSDKKWVPQWVLGILYRLGKDRMLSAIAKFDIQWEPCMRFMYHLYLDTYTLWGKLCKCHHQELNITHHCMPV